MRILFVLFLFLGACTHPSVQLTEDAKRTEQIDSFLETLRHLLQTKDLTGLAAHYPLDRQDEIQALAPILAPMDEPRLDFFIDRIVLDQDVATVALHWEFRWGHPPEPAKSPLRRGNATLHLKGSEDLRLEAIEGDNPFLAPLAVFGREKISPQ